MRRASTATARAIAIGLLLTGAALSGAVLAGAGGAGGPGETGGGSVTSAHWWDYWQGD